MPKDSICMIARNLSIPKSRIGKNSTAVNNANMMNKLPLMLKNATIRLRVFSFVIWTKPRDLTFVYLSRWPAKSHPAIATVNPILLPNTRTAIFRKKRSDNERRSRANNIDAVMINVPAKTRQSPIIPSSPSRCSISRFPLLSWWSLSLNRFDRTFGGLFQL